MLLMVLFYYQQLLIILKANPNLSSLLGVVTSAPQASVLATLTGATAAALSQFTLRQRCIYGCDCEVYLVGKRCSITTILRYHLENGNRTASSATSFTASTATADV
jgi:hypothetical protein